MKSTALAGLHPVEEGQLYTPTPRTYKIRFSSTEVGPHEFPLFPYSLTYVQASDIVYTAIIESDSLDKAVKHVTTYFSCPTILQVTADCNTFDDRDVLPGSQIRGFIEIEKKSGFLARVFGWLK